MLIFKRINLDFDYQQSTKLTELLKQIYIIF